MPSDPNQPLWTPSLERASRANITAFARNAGFDNFADLHRWSLEQPRQFWSAVWDFVGVVGEKGEPIMQGEGMLETRFFPQARLNVSENLLPCSGPDPALIAHTEDGARREISWDELREQVMQVAGALQAEGVGPGDRVAAWMPLCPEAIILLLATSALGATFSSTSPDFGVLGVLDRFEQIEPKILVACKSYSYGGKTFDCLERLGEIQQNLPTLKRTVVVGAKASELQNAVPWPDWAFAQTPLERFERFPFDQPWLILFSSGTTGKPKCIVHRAGGVLLNLKKEHVLHCDVRPGDRVMYFTTTGWMMFNWLVGALASGATLVLYDGSPFYPDPARLPGIVAQEGVSLWGVGAKYIDALKKSGLEPIRTHDFTRLRTLCSTGSPLSPESFAWIYQGIKKDLHLASISGGTDLCGCFVLGNPTQPVFAGEIQGPGLGMAVDVWDLEGHSLKDKPGERGELVCTQAFPSQPLGFWGDLEGKRYFSAYYAKFPGIWAHGDFAAWTQHGGLVIHGRSDTTLNPGGVRIGTAEIYRVVEDIPGIQESLVFGQNWQDDVRVVLLVRLAPGAELNGELEAEIKRRIRQACTPRHVPARIIAVDDLPRTRSNKLVELAVADAVNGNPVRNTEALANPEALWAIATLEALKQ